MPNRWLEREEYLKVGLRIALAKAIFERDIKPHDYAMAYVKNKLQNMLYFLVKVLSKSPQEHDANREKLEQKLQSALNHKSLSEFTEIFSDLSYTQLRMIIKEENFPAFANFHTSTPLHISPSHIETLASYCAEKNLAAVISIRSGEHNFMLAAGGLDSAAPQAIHSVGKVFTGALLLLLVHKKIIDESVLREPIKLEQEVLAQLSIPVQERLKNVKLLDVMVHKSGLQDYYTPYTMMLQQAIDSGGAMAIPEINSCEDFLRYADKDVLNLDAGEKHYSNLGILLVGLTIQYHYRHNTQSTLTYDEILRKFLIDIDEIKCSIFATHRPSNGQYNQADKYDLHAVGGPAGGYWTTAGDLQKLGAFLNKLCASDPEFKRLLEAYGGEFYKNNMFVHDGSIKSASSQFVSIPENDTTIVILSTQPLVAPQLYEAIVDHTRYDNSESVLSVQRIVSTSTSVNAGQENSASLATTLIYANQQK